MNVFSDIHFTFFACAEKIIIKFLMSSYVYFKVMRIHSSDVNK